MYCWDCFHIKILYFSSFSIVIQLVLIKSLWKLVSDRNGTVIFTVFPLHVWGFYHYQKGRGVCLLPILLLAFVSNQLQVFQLYILSIWSPLLLSCSLLLILQVMWPLSYFSMLLKYSCKSLMSLVTLHCSHTFLKCSDIGCSSVITVLKNVYTQLLVTLV